jgi:DNA-binding beta-propeller fold protein YncE
MKTTLLTASAVAVLTVAVAAPALADPSPIESPRITAHFDLAAGQTPENFAVSPAGTAFVTFVGNRTVARVSTNGKVHVLTTMPNPKDGGVNTPLSGAAAPTGIIRADDGTLYIGYAAGDASLTGLWRLSPGGTPHRIAALPAGSFPNGLALDRTGGKIYIADSALATIWRVPISGGKAIAWKKDKALARSSFAGANGLKVHDRAIWTTNTDTGRLLRIPITHTGRAGRIQVRAKGLTGVDDFAFTGQGDQTLAALFGSSKLVLVSGKGTHKTVLDASDGLQNPTAVTVRKSKVYVDSSGRTTGVDPNLLVAHFSRD